MNAEASFEVWYREEYKRVLAVVAVLAGDLDLARDVTAEAFARALERWDRVGAMESPAAWTHRVAVNVLRRKRRRAALERRLLLGHPPPAVATVEERDLDLWLAVARLPRRARQAVVLHYLGGLTEGEVAGVMGIAPGTVAASLHTARRRLAEFLNPAPLMESEPTDG